jgi:hypothetical protein
MRSTDGEDLREISNTKRLRLASDYCQSLLALSHPVIRVDLNDDVVEIFEDNISDDGLVILQRSFAGSSSRHDRRIHPVEVS